MLYARILTHLGDLILYRSCVGVHGYSEFMSASAMSFLEDRISHQSSANSDLAFCLSYFSTAVIRHHDQDNIDQKAFLWASWKQAGREGSGMTAENSHLEPMIREKESETGNGSSIF